MLRYGRMTQGSGFCGRGFGIGDGDHLKEGLYSALSAGGEALGGDCG